MIAQFDIDQLFTENGKLTERAWKLLRQLVQLQILTGSGSPEGVIDAKITTLYMDTAGTAGNILYIKKLADISGDRSQGWILV
jgi:hypothetical protein